MQDLNELKLQSLRIPKGWEVIINKFYDIDPQQNLEIKGLPNNNGWMLFESTLLLLRNKHHVLDLDLGWSPYWKPEGCFILQLNKGEEWEEKLLRFESRSKAEIVAKIESVLAEIHLQEL